MRPDQHAAPAPSVNPLRLAALLLAALAVPAAAQPVTIFDPAGDLHALRTDYGNNGPIPAPFRRPDLVELRRGRFEPLVPHDDLFDGAWSPSGGFLRIDVVFAGLVNPPGPLGWDDDLPEYDPERYGPGPVYGWIEFDLDADETTGGELANPAYRYVGVVARHGGLPTDPRFAGRVALDYADFDGDVETPPFVDRSGEEFHIAFLGEDVERIEIDYERPGGDPDIFEAGEVWRVEGDLFHRAHGFEDYAFTCIDGRGRYKPDIYLRFAHDEMTDRTTVSLVFPLTNAAAAAAEGPGTPVEPNDGCDDNQFSIEEALDDLQFSAMYADPWDRAQPEFQLLAGWEFKNVADHLDPAGWRAAVLVGTAFLEQQPDQSRCAWTDVWPNVRVGDFNGDGLLDAADVVLLDAFIAQRDGDPAYDDDENPSNGELEIPGFAKNFSLFDTNYDGFVRPSDAVVPGDMDLNRLVNPDDADDFVLALLDPTVYQNTYGVDPAVRGDLNGDGLVNADDIAGFVALLTGGSP